MPRACVGRTQDELLIAASKACFENQASNIKWTNPDIIGKQFRLKMSPFCTCRLVGKLCAPSVLIPDCNQDQAEIKKKGYEIFFVKRRQKATSRHGTFRAPWRRSPDFSYNHGPRDTGAMQRIMCTLQLKLKKSCSSFRNAFLFFVPT